MALGLWTVGSSRCCGRSAVLEADPNAPCRPPGFCIYRWPMTLSPPRCISAIWVMRETPLRPDFLEAKKHGDVVELRIPGFFAYPLAVNYPLAPGSEGISRPLTGNVSREDEGIYRAVPRDLRPIGTVCIEMVLWDGRLSFAGSPLANLPIRSYREVKRLMPQSQEMSS